MSNKECTATAEVDSLPGCSQIAVIHSAFVVPEERNKGVGYKAHLERIEQLWGELNYDAAICTVDATNEAERKILRASGWTNLSMFESRKTGHNVCLFWKKLTRNTLNVPLVKTYDDYLKEMEDATKSD